MTPLTVDANGKVMLYKDLLRRFGAHADEKIKAEPILNSGAILQMTRKTHNVAEAFGILTSDNKDKICLILRDMDEIAMARLGGRAISITTVSA